MLPETKQYLVCDFDIQEYIPLINLEKKYGGLTGPNQIFFLFHSCETPTSVLEAQVLLMRHN